MPEFEAGDFIVAINGESSDELSLFEVRKLLKVAGQSVRLTISRNPKSPFDVAFTLLDYHGRLAM